MTVRKRHGRSRYRWHGCRCARCRKAEADYQREYRARRTSESVPDFAHGSRYGYVKLQCRCDRCRQANAEYERARARRRAAGNRPFRFADLENKIGGTTINVAVLLGVDRRQVLRLRQSGLTVDQADEFAVRAGFHPGEIWEQWADFALFR